MSGQRAGDVRRASRSVLERRAGWNPSLYRLSERTQGAARVTAGTSQPVGWAPAPHVVEFIIPMVTAVHQAICEMIALARNRARALRGSVLKRTFRGNRASVVVHRVIATPLSESTRTAP